MLQTYLYTYNNQNTFTQSLGDGSFAYDFSVSFSGLVWYCVLATALAGLLCWLPVAFAPKKLVLEKNSSYECGFEPFFNNNTRHEVHFIVVSILFVIFDLELVLLTPMVSASTSLGVIGYDLQMIFAYILVAGLVYEWFSGVLNWPVFYWTSKNKSNVGVNSETIMRRKDGLDL